MLKTVVAPGVAPAVKPEEPVIMEYKNRAAKLNQKLQAASVLAPLPEAGAVVDIEDLENKLAIVYRL